MILTFELIQHIAEPPHNQGHTLDLVTSKGLEIPKHVSGFVQTCLLGLFVRYTNSSRTLSHSDVSSDFNLSFVFLVVV